MLAGTCTASKIQGLDFLKPRQIRGRPWTSPSREMETYDVHQRRQRPKGSRQSMFWWHRFTLLWLWWDTGTSTWLRLMKEELVDQLFWYHHGVRRWWCVLWMMVAENRKKSGRLAIPRDVSWSVFHRRDFSQRSLVWWTPLCRRYGLRTAAITFPEVLVAWLAHNAILESVGTHDLTNRCALSQFSVPTSEPPHWTAR